jgi:hypothetical protein
MTGLAREPLGALDLGEAPATIRPATGGSDKSVIVLPRTSCALMSDV